MRRWSGSALPAIQAELNAHRSNASAHHTRPTDGTTGGQIDSGTTGIWDHTGATKLGLGKVHLGTAYEKVYLERYYLVETQPYPFEDVTLQYFNSGDPFDINFKYEKPGELEAAATSWAPPPSGKVNRYVTVRQHYDPGGWPEYNSSTTWDEYQITVCPGTSNTEWVATIYRKKAAASGNGDHNAMVELFVLKWPSSGVGEVAPIGRPSGCGGSSDDRIEHKKIATGVSMSTIQSRTPSNYYKVGGTPWDDARKASSFVEYW